MHQVAECPICNGNQFKKKYICTDFTCSHEAFQIVECENCKLLLTSPRPEESQLGRYYQSDKYISHSDTSKGLTNKLYKQVRTFTIDQKLRFIKSLSPEGKLLDIGSGAGYFLEACQKSGFNCTGIEPDTTTRERSILQFNISCYPEAELDKLEENSFDIITLWHVLEHVPNLIHRIHRIHQLLKPDAYALIALPNHHSLDAQFYKAYWAGYDVPRHLWHFSPKNIQQLALLHGFEVVKIKPMVFDAFYVSMLSENYLQHRFSFLRGAWIGLVSNLNSLFSKSPKSSSQIYVLKKRLHLNG